MMEKSNPAFPGTGISIKFLWLTQKILQNKHHFIYYRYKIAGGRLWYSEFTLLPDGPKSLDCKRNLRSRNLTQTSGRNMFSCQAHALPKVTLWLRVQQFTQNLSAQLFEDLPQTAQKHKAEKE